MTISSLNKIQGWPGGSQYKLHARGGFATVRQVFDWSEDGSTDPPSTALLAMADGAPAQGVAPLGTTNDNEFVVCGSWTMLKVCVGLEADGYQGPPIDLTLGFTSRIIGGAGVSTNYASFPLPPPAVVGLEESDFDVAVTLSEAGGRLGSLAVAGLDALGNAQDFKLWQTSIWLVEP